MGLFDLPAPLFAALDNLMGGLPAYPRLLIWATLTGIISMALYWLCSAQEKTGAAKERAIEARRRMAAYDGTEFDEMWPLAKESLVASGKHFGIVLGPALLSSLPALAIIVWISNAFGYTLPEPGDTVDIYTEPATALVGIGRAEDGSTGVSGDPEAGIYQVVYPAADQSTAIATTSAEVLVTLPLKAAIPVVHKQAWWNSLISNGNGYLDDSGPVEAIYFDLRPQEFLAFGPSWIRGWEFSYFVLLIIVSLVIKVAFRIH
jgi:hypothetical protein